MIYSEIEHLGKTFGKQKTLTESRMRFFLTLGMAVIFVVAVGSAVSYAQSIKNKMPDSIVTFDSSFELKMAMPKLNDNLRIVLFHIVLE